MIISEDTSIVVRVGTKVTIEINGLLQSWQIVDSGKSDVLQGKISREAPLIKQILGKKKGDKIYYKIIDKNITVIIKKVSLF